MMRVGLFVDTTNLYHCCKKKHGTKPNYEALMGQAQKLGLFVATATAYVTQISDEANGFIHALKSTGFNVYDFKSTDQHKRISWSPKMTMDILTSLEKLDAVVIGSSDRSLAPIVQHIMAKGIPVFILACGIPAELKVAKCLEITPDLCESSATSP